MSLRPSKASRTKARIKLSEPGRVGWKTVRSGPCCGCGRRGPLVNHHVVYEQHVRRENGDPWDPRNAMPLGRYCPCHGKHHAPNGRTPLPLSKVPAAAVAFARELLGDRADTYLHQHYSNDRNP